MPKNPSPSPNVLIVDDQQDVLTALRVLLNSEGYATDEARSPAEATASVADSDFDVVLMDLNYTKGSTAGTEGLGLLEQLLEQDPKLAVVVMTAWSNVGLAVDAMRRGARDFVEKPWDNERLLSLLRVQLELKRATEKAERLEQENALLRIDSDEAFIAHAETMQPVLDLIRRVGPSDANVLVTGESGAGKGVVARALHAASNRSDQLMITVNTGGLSETLFESELFGHVKGAFTDARSDRAGRFEVANGGTLFLDEIANLSLAMQARLLRVIETGEFERVGSSKTLKTDARIISATNADLASDSREGVFRHDLLYRLNTVEVKIPSLRERADDILPLATHFLDRYAKQYRKSIKGFENDAINTMMAHDWPGNIRELDHTIERGVLMAAGDRLNAVDLGLGRGVSAERSLDAMSLEEIEAYQIRRALGRCGGNVKDAAEALGLSRSGMYRRMQKHGIGSVTPAPPAG